MLPRFILIVLTTINIARLYALDVLKVEPTFLADLFIDYKNYFTIKSGYPESILYSNDMNRNERDLVMTSYFQEHCALDCLKNTFCLRYAYNEDSQQCTLRLHKYVPRRFEYDDRTASKLKAMKLNLAVCSDGVYCMDSGRPFCDVSSNLGTDCQYKIQYELTQWSEWSTCSVTCDVGFSKRFRTCHRVYFDPVRNMTMNETIANNDWLCNRANDPGFATIETKECLLSKCSMYSNWTDWTPCNKMCNGYRSRSRTCLLDPSHLYCESIYLNEMEICGFKDCSASVLKLNDPIGGDGPATIGTLQLLNTDSNRVSRVFIAKNDLAAKVAQVACIEFGYNGYNWANVRPANEVKAQFNGNLAAFTQFLNEKSLYGLECTGQEQSIKDCKVNTTATFETNLFEIDLECVVNGYWSEWSPWSECSVSCGNGIHTRQRLCNNPPPTLSEFKNGTPCPGSSTASEQCTMPKCSG